MQPRRNARIHTTNNVHRYCTQMPDFVPALRLGCPLPRCTCSTLPSPQAPSGPRIYLHAPFSFWPSFFLFTPFHLIPLFFDHPTYMSSLFPITYSFIIISYPSHAIHFPLCSTYDDITLVSNATRPMFLSPYLYSYLFYFFTIWSPHLRHASFWS